MRDRDFTVYELAYFQSQRCERPLTLEERYTHIYICIFYFRNPEHTHNISTYKNNKKNSGAMAKRRA